MPNHISSTPEISSGVTRDGTYQTVDLSSHVDAATVGVMLHVAATTATEYEFGVRHPDSTTDFTETRVEDNGHYWICVGVNSAKEIELRMESGSSTEVHLWAEFLSSEATFFTEPKEVSLSHTDTWNTVSISSLAASGESIANSVGFFWTRINGAGGGNNFGIRHPDHTADLRGGHFGDNCRGAICLTNASEQIEYRSSFSTNFSLYLIGYIHDATLVNLEDPVESDVGSTTGFDTETYDGAGADDVGIYAMLGDDSAVTSEWQADIRPTGSTWASGGNRDLSNFTWVWVPIDGSDQYERYSNNASRGVIIVGASEAPPATTPQSDRAIDVSGRAAVVSSRSVSVP